MKKNTSHLLTSSSSEQNEPNQKEIGILTLVRGLVDNKPHYAYAIIPPELYLVFKEAERKGDYNLADFGEIVAEGVGFGPPEEIRKKMQEEYGASETFEKELIQSMQQA